MQTFKQYLEESKPILHLPSTGVPVYRITHINVLKNLLKGAGFHANQARGKIFLDHLDIWNGFNAIHHDYNMAVENGKEGMDVYIELKSGVPGGVLFRTSGYGNTKIFKDLAKSPFWKKLIPGWDPLENIVV